MSELFLTTERLQVATRGDAHVVDLTEGLAELVRKQGLEEGTVLVFVSGSTAALTTIEFEPGLLRDLPELLEKLVPRAVTYHHDRTWHDGNGHSHLQASLLGPSLTIPVQAGRMTLGTWQQVVLVDLDTRPRTRALVVQLQGKKSSAAQG